MESDIPSFAVLIVLQLGVVGLTVMATWRYARYRFGPRVPRKSPPQEERLKELETTIDRVIKEVERLDEGHAFVEQLLMDRLTRARGGSSAKKHAGESGEP